MNSFYYFVHMQDFLKIRLVGIHYILNYHMHQNVYLKMNYIITII